MVCAVDRIASTRYHRVLLPQDRLCRAVAQGCACQAVGYVPALWATSATRATTHCMQGLGLLQKLLQQPLLVLTSQG